MKSNGGRRSLPRDGAYRARLPAILAACWVGSVEYERLLGNCNDAVLVAKFRAMEQVRRRNVVQYETQTGAAPRMAGRKGH